MILTTVIPAIDEQPNIGRAVESALASGSAEVIVVDGGSRDQTAAVAKQYGAQVVRSEPGRAIQQNLGASLAVGDALLFLHADCWLGPQVGRQVDESLHGSGAVAGALRQSIGAPGLKYRMLERGNAARVRWLGMAYGDQAIFVRRATFDAIGGFPEVPIMEDVRLMRALRREGRLALLPGPVHVSPRRWRQSGVLRQTLRNWSMLTAHRLGVPPERLARHYPNHADAEFEGDSNRMRRPIHGE